MDSLKNLLKEIRHVESILVHKPTNLRALRGKVRSWLMINVNMILFSAEATFSVSDKEIDQEGSSGL